MDQITGLDKESGILDEQANPAQALVPAAASKPVMGSCVGVLYRCNSSVNHPSFCTNCGGTEYCVHNGRLVTNTKSYILINHFVIDKGSPKEETRIFYKTNQYPHLIEFRVTPDLPQNHPHYCQAFRKPMGASITPHDCVGILIKDPTKPYGVDIKNGRYLYWEEKDGTPHCVLTPHEPRLYRIYYSHYPKQKCGPGGAKPIFTAEFTFKDDVITAIKLSDKNLGAKARC